VAQITIALIYKFMDDMDAEAEELGGQRTFFAGDYARFGWAKLMAPGLGGFGVPELFRDIFKNAYAVGGAVERGCICPLFKAWPAPHAVRLPTGFPRK
jgi:hypothetical protein